MFRNEFVYLIDSQIINNINDLEAKYKKFKRTKRKCGKRKFLIEK